MSTKAEHGFALLSFIIIVALIGTLSFYRGWHGMKILQRRSDFAHARSAEYVAQQEALVEASSATPVHNLPLTCSEHAAQSADITITRRLCTRHNLGAGLILERPIIEGVALAHRQRFPQLNYNEIYHEFTRCPGSFIRSAVRSPLGFVLSPLSSASKNVCFGISQSNSSHVAYKANLALSDEITIPENTKILAATGYIDSASGLTINSDMLIVAGGDMHLKKLGTAASHVRVTILSATGIVMLEEISGNIELRAIAWQGVFVPANASLSIHAIVPPDLQDQLVSLTAATQD